MSKGVNKASIEGLLNKYPDPIDEYQKTCVFLSHRSEDKTACKIIAKYLSEAEIDYYLDENDVDLQQAVASGDPSKITDNIKTGITRSTHMLVVISEKTYLSQWVPFAYNTIWKSRGFLIDIRVRLTRIQTPHVS